MCAHGTDPIRAGSQVRDEYRDDYDAGRGETGVADV